MFWELKRVAEELGLSRRTVHWYVQQGRLRALRVGGQFIVRPEDVQRFVEERGGTGRFPKRKAG